MPQTMRVWPGLKLIGAGGRVSKGIYVHVTEVGPEKIVLDGGDSFTHAALLKHTRLCHAITYASCQGLTLEGEGLPVRHREPTLHSQAPLRGHQPGHQQRAPERALEGARGTGGLVGFELQIRHFEQ